MSTARRTAIALALGVACARGAPAPSGESGRSPVAPSERSPTVIRLDRFETEIAAFEAADRLRLPAPGGIVFVGSSSIRLWKSLASDFAELPVHNRGFGGSTLPEVNHYVARIVLPYRPRTIVLYAGDNDVAVGRTPRQVADDYRTFVRLVRDSLPAARIVVIGIKPSPSRWQLVEAQREANRLVADIARADTLQSFVDVFPPMLGANGHPRPELFIGDSLHMTPAGYVIWRAQVAPRLR